jgi:hypothetical protein
VLYLNIRWRKIPLFPEESSDKAAVFYTVADGVELSVEFRFTGRGVKLLYERCKLVKTR